MTQINVTNEIFINLGNTGFFTEELQTQSFLVSFATPSGVYVRAGANEFDAFSTPVFYVSGTVVEGGDIVTLTPNGDVPAEFKGKALVTDAVVLTPEIFLTASDLADPDAPEPAPTPDPPLDDGKVADPLNVILLLHADNPAWFDSSTYTRTILTNGAPVFDPLRKAFGSGSLKLPADDSNDALFVEISDDSLFSLEDESFTFEARIRLDSVDAKTHTLFSFGESGDSYLDLNLVLDPVSSDKVVLNWKRETVDGENGATVFDQIELPVASGKFLTKPEIFQQFAFVYDKIQGHFAAYLDGERIGFVDASAFVSPVWNGLNVLPKPTGVVAELGVGSLVPIDIDDGSQFEGQLDEVRLTLREALYQTVSLSSAVYSFAWPDPILQDP